MKILLIESDKQLARGLMDTFRGGDTIRWVETIEGGLEWLNDNRVDFILVDLDLPEHKGLDALRALAACKAPKIALTAHSHIHMVKEGAKLGLLDYVPKDDIYDISERIHFNITRLTKRSSRFAPEIFEQIKGYVCPPVGRLTTA